MPERRGKGGPGGKPGPKMSAAQKVLRDAAIIAALHAGEPVRDVAKAYELTSGQVKRIFEAFKLRPTSIDAQPMEIVERAIRLYEQQMHSFAALAEDTLSRAPAVAVAALKGHADALERYLRLLSDVGKLPENLDLLRNETEMLRIGREMVAALERVSVGEMSGVEAQARLGELLFGTPSWDASSDVVELEPGEEDEPDDA